MASELQGMDDQLQGLDDDNEKSWKSTAGRKVKWSFQEINETAQLVIDHMEKKKVAAITSGRTKLRRI
eukprot:9115597-Pyramimonas_sp.AAC.1